MERLDKILSSQGICSRKDVKTLIKNKRVKINGAFPPKSDIKLDPEHDTIEIDGSPVIYRKYIYIMMNKPQGVLSASSDSRDTTVVDLLPEELKRKSLFPAGRLDKDTTGLLIITDDGAFAHNMLSPKKHVPKLYHAVLDGDLTDSSKHILENGITLNDGTVYKPASIGFLDSRHEVSVEICEGKFHQVKRMFEFVGLTVVKLKRIRIGNLKLDESLNKGDCRLLSNDELTAIWDSNNS